MMSTLPSQGGAWGQIASVGSANNPRPYITVTTLLLLLLSCCCSSNNNNKTEKLIIINYYCLSFYYMKEAREKTHYVSKASVKKGEERT